MAEQSDQKDLSFEKRRRQVDWKLLFNQLFALEIKKEHILSRGASNPDQQLQELLSAYTQYSPVSFNDALEELSSMRSSDAAYLAKKAFYENPANQRLIAELDFSRSVGDQLRRYPDVREFLDVIWSCKDRLIAEDENFFESVEGQNVVESFRRDGGKNVQDVTIVLIPGFAGHTIKYPLFEEIWKDINVHNDRPAERPLMREDGIDIVFEDHVAFYGRSSNRRPIFDIIQPAGIELGNTMGPNEETTEKVYQWINTLPKKYRKTKLVFVGYSKGAPVVFELLQRHPELVERVLGVVTFCGVIQGTQVARQFLEQAGSVLRDVPVGEFLEKLRDKEPSHLGTALSPLFSDIDLSWLSIPRIRAVFDILGYDIGPLERQIEQVLGSREIRESLDGARDLSPLERVRWNLLHYNSETFSSPMYHLNLSALTDVTDFVRPAGLRKLDPEMGSMLVPALTAEGQLDWEHLSLDALFLYVTSIEGFKLAPAGLFDTQVDLAGTKSPLIDRRPLSESLDEEELRSLWEDAEVREILERRGISSLEQLAHSPRRDLTPRSERSTIDAVDLGEFKGHHWAPFIQALRPPPELSSGHAVWDFPRKAFMRALLQLISFYNLVKYAEPDGNGKEGLAKTSHDSVIPQADSMHRDVVLVRTEGVDPVRQYLFNLYNLTARSLMYGFVVNSARTGLGTTPEIGPSLETESLYYQAVRVFSYFDSEFRRGLLDDENVWPLPRTAAVLVARLPGAFASGFAEERLDRIVELRSALKVLFPHLEPFELRRFTAGDYSVSADTGDVDFSEEIRENLWRGTRAKLQAIERDAYGEESSTAKLEAMLGAFTPLCTVISAGFDRSAPEKSYTRLTLYLPAYHTLHADILDDPADWRIERGLRDLELPRPIRLPTAEITNLRYLHEADFAKSQAIKIEQRRDFDSVDEVTTVASFGRLFEASSDDLFGFDTSDHREALHVVFRPRFAQDDDDKPADRTFKEAFNRVFSPFQIEARIHRLTLYMRKQRKSRGAIVDDEVVLRPRFSLEESKISFRVHRIVETGVERLPLQAAGFTCEEIRGVPGKYRCYRDFWTWDHLLEEFFSGRNLGSSRLRLPTYFRERLVEQVVGSATRVVVDRSISSIEDAIDDEIARVAEHYLKRYTKARSVLVDRLHEQLFEEK